MKPLSLFLQQAREAHGARYDYSRVAYAGRDTKIVIICPEHGAFTQVPASHVKGHGCAKCNFRFLNQDWVDRAGDRMATLYLLQIFKGKERFYKIGVTIQSIAERYKNPAALNGYKYKVVAINAGLSATDAYTWEQRIISEFKPLQYWPSAHFVGASECFSNADGILSIFPK